MSVGVLNKHFTHWTVSLSGRPPVVVLNEAMVGCPATGGGEGDDSCSITYRLFLLLPPSLPPFIPPPLPYPLSLSPLLSLSLSCPSLSFFVHPFSEGKA